MGTRMNYGTRNSASQVRARAVVASERTSAPKGPTSKQIDYAGALARSCGYESGHKAARALGLPFSRSGYAMLIDRLRRQRNAQRETESPADSRYV